MLNNLSLCLLEFSEFVFNSLLMICLGVVSLNLSYFKFIELLRPADLISFKKIKFGIFLAGMLFEKYFFCLFSTLLLGLQK